MLKNQFTQDHLCNSRNIDATDQAVGKAICERQLPTVSAMTIKSDCFALIEIIAMSASAVTDGYGKEYEFAGLPVVPHVNKVELDTKQRGDQCLKHIISQIGWMDRNHYTH